jgi:hypothetical protein
MITIDNFLTDPDRVREDLLELDYTKSQPNVPGWKGYRCLCTNMIDMELNDLIKIKLNEIDSKFIGSHLRCFSHYTLKEHTSSDNIHTDYMFDYAGVLYLTPNPEPNSGTAFYNESGEEIDYVENIYNRLTIYSSNIPHSLKESFGDNINNGRLVYTIFIKLDKSDNKPESSSNFMYNWIRSKSGK